MDMDRQDFAVIENEIADAAEAPTTSSNVCTQSNFATTNALESQSSQNEYMDVDVVAITEAVTIDNAVTTSETVAIGEAGANGNSIDIDEADGTDNAIAIDEPGAIDNTVANDDEASSVSTENTGPDPIFIVPILEEVLRARDPIPILEEINALVEEARAVPLGSIWPDNNVEVAMVDDLMHDVPQRFGSTPSNFPLLYQGWPSNPRLVRDSHIPIYMPPLIDSTSSSSEDAVQPVRIRISVRRVQEAIRNVIASGQHTADGLPVTRENLMQRMRRAIFRMGHNREGSGANDNAAPTIGDDDENGEDVVDDGVQSSNEAAAVRAADEAHANSIRFDTNLPVEHSYLGTNMDRVSGVEYLEVGQRYRMMLFMHQHILFPGEVLPFMTSASVIDEDIDAQNGLLFGVCFTFLRRNASTSIDSRRNLQNAEELPDDAVVYGVTCQIYEKGTDSSGNTLIKSRALQRFIAKKIEFSGPLQSITSHPQAKCYGYVQILEEIYLPDPLTCINMGSMNRFRDSSSMSGMYRRYQAASTPWPAHIYNSYSTSAIIEKARTQLAQHKIDTMPTDSTQLSFWLVRNLALSESMIKTIFMTDSVNTRLSLISSTFKEDDLFTCRFCDNRIANCRELFAMSKHGVQTQYCNSAGFIHETNTVYQLLRHAVTHSGLPSTEFSWFPGYEWQIIVCKMCSRHIGWEFKAVKENLVPRSFFGISSSSVRVSSALNVPSNPREVIYQNFMAIARGETQ